VSRRPERTTPARSKGAREGGEERRKGFDGRRWMEPERLERVAGQKWEDEVRTRHR